MVIKIREATEEIDEEIVHRWIEDLVLYKTYTGLGRNEETIFEKLSEEYGTEHYRSTPEEESRGTGGYLKDQSVSIKPETYRRKGRLREDIQAPIVYYEEYKNKRFTQVAS